MNKFFCQTLWTSLCNYCDFNWARCWGVVYLFCCYGDCYQCTNSLVCFDL